MLYFSDSFFSLHFPSLSSHFQLNAFVPKFFMDRVLSISFFFLYEPCPSFVDCFHSVRPLCSLHVTFLLFSSPAESIFVLNFLIERSLCPFHLSSVFVIPSVYLLSSFMIVFCTLCLQLNSFLVFRRFFRYFFFLSLYAWMVRIMCTFSSFALCMWLWIAS